MTDATAIIATLFDPPTLGPLVDAFHAEGVKTLVVRGKRTNEAWEFGLGKVKTRYVMIANDDIEVYPKRGFVARLMAHHAKGFTHLLPTMWRSLNTISSHGEQLSHGPGWAQKRSLLEAHPVDKGHFISMDRRIKVPPIPDGLTVFYGDDWFYWHHERVGRCGIATDVQVRTGGDLGREGFEGTSGWTQDHEGLDKAVGEPFKELATREHKLAPEYFEFYRDEAMEHLNWWHGFSSGLKAAS